MKYSICICIISYNRLDYTKRCIDSFIEHAPPSWSMVIVDNGSTDGTRPYLQQRFAATDNVKVVEAEKNLFPAGGNKRALEFAFPSESYLLCDNDGLFLTKEWYAAGRTLLDHSNIGLVNMRASRWREDSKLGNDLHHHQDIAYLNTTHVASFSMINEAVRQALIRNLRGKWIGKTIGRIATQFGQRSVALKEGLIWDQSENDLNNEQYREQYRKFWKEKHRLKQFDKMVAKLNEEQGAGYKNPRRNTGSQEEQPSVVLKKNVLYVTGYQRYQVHRGEVKLESKNRKYEKVLQWIDELRPLRKSYADLGCSNGVLPFSMAERGLSNILAADHDLDCVNVIERVSARSGLEVEARHYRFGDAIGKYDVVSALAIIHWIWNCTAKYESFDAIFEYLCSICNEYLIIEWVDPEDVAIQKFRHLDFGNKEGYTHEAFLAAVNRIGTIVKAHPWHKTRTLYLIEL